VLLVDKLWFKNQYNYTVDDRYQLQKNKHQQEETAYLTKAASLRVSSLSRIRREVLEDYRENSWMGGHSMNYQYNLSIINFPFEQQAFQKSNAWWHLKVAGRLRAIVIGLSQYHSTRLKGVFMYRASDTP